MEGRDTEKLISIYYVDESMIEKMKTGIVISVSLMVHFDVVDHLLQKLPPGYIQISMIIDDVSQLIFWTITANRHLKYLNVWKLWPAYFVLACRTYYMKPLCKPRSVRKAFFGPVRCTTCFGCTEQCSMYMGTLSFAKRCLLQCVPTPELVCVVVVLP